MKESYREATENILKYLYPFAYGRMMRALDLENIDWERKHNELWAEFVQKENANKLAVTN